MLNVIGWLASVLRIPLAAYLKSRLLFASPVNSKGMLRFMALTGTVTSFLEIRTASFCAPLFMAAKYISIIVHRLAFLIALGFYHTQGPKIWSSLPDSFEMAKNTKEFKDLIKT